MKFVKSNYRKKGLILLLLSFGMIFANVGFSSLNFPLNFTSINEETNLENDFDYKEQTPKTSEYQNFDGAGENLNIALHQSYLNTSTIEFSNLDSSNFFQKPAPIVNGFNSSFVNITIDDIYAPNKSLIVEDVDDGSTNLFLVQYWTSFEVKGSCYLENFSVMVHTSGSGDTFNIDLFNATLSGSDIIYDSDLDGGVVWSSVFVNDPTTHWENLTSLDTYLNVDNTYNNTFFIRMSSVSGDGYWHEEDESDGDDSIVWRTSGSSPETKDMTLKMDLFLLDNTPKPSDINFKINSTNVNDINNQNKGFWNSTSEYNDYNGNLDFELTSDWYDVSCNVTRVQINYTKTDLQAGSEFNIAGSGQTDTSR